MGCHNAFKSGELDIRGIDIVLSLRNGFCLLLQVKSSEAGLRTHYERHPLIPAFVAKREMSDIQIAATVLKIIRRQAKRSFEIATCYHSGKSRELKRLGADMLVALHNGFGLFLRREGGENYENRDRPCPRMPIIKIPDTWNTNDIETELKKIIATRQKQFFEVDRYPKKTK